MRPLPWKFNNGAVVLGAYAAAQQTGALAATIGALTTTSGANALAAIRFPTNNYGAKMVLSRLRVGLTITSAVTTAVETSVCAAIVRSFTSQYSGGSPTTLSLAGDTGKMDRNMASSLMGANGPVIAATAVLSTVTLTGDGGPFCAVTFPNPSPTLGAAAVTNQVGCGTLMQDLYSWEQMGGHPPVLAGNEGIIVGLLQAGPASGTFKLVVEWSWAEVINPFGMG